MCYNNTNTVRHCKNTISLKGVPLKKIDNNIIIDKYHFNGYIIKEGEVVKIKHHFFKKYEDRFYNMLITRVTDNYFEGIIYDFNIDDTVEFMISIEDYLENTVEIKLYN